MLDNVPQGWSILRLGDVCTKLGSGATPRGGSAVYLTDGTSLIRSQNIYNHGFERGGLAFIDETHAKELSNVTIEADDVLLNITGDSVARACQVPLDVLPARVNQHVLIIRPNPKALVPRLLRFALTAPKIQDHLLGLASAGATRNALTKSMVEDLLIVVPPVAEQEAIADVLGTLENKIELNRRINETLEHMAQSMFVSWFVHFDPVQARVVGKNLAGMDAETSSLFPSSFIKSQHGAIPEGWTVGVVGDVCDVNPPRKLASGSLAPYLDMANMPTKSARALEVYDRKFGSGMKFKNGDTLVARITPCLENGKTAYVDFLNEGEVGWGSTEYIVLRPKQDLPTEFAYFLARTEDFRANAIANMTGTSGRQRVPADAIARYKLVIPPPDVAAAFGDFARDVLTKIKANDEESRTLAGIRDALLPKLISGTVRLPAEMVSQFETEK